MKSKDGFSGREISFIPDRLIADPVVFRGLTDTEVVALIIGGTAFWIPVCVIALIPFGAALFGIALGFGLGILTLVLAAGRLSKLKRRMPDGLHVVYLKKQAQRKFSFVNFGYIDTSGVWDIRRTKAVNKMKKTEDEEWDMAE